MTDYSRITLAPNVLTGKPVIRGTRLSVEFVIGLMRTGGVKRIWWKTILESSMTTSLRVSHTLATR